MIVLDDNPSAGGQIWREAISSSTRRVGGEDRPRTRAFAALARSGAKLLAGCRVFQAQGTERIDAVQEVAGGKASAVAFRCEQLVLATGARERFLPFPGWTLPGVYGAGGLQAFVKGGLAVAGRRIVIAGSGPLLLAVAAHLRADGAHIPFLAEQASSRQLAGFACSLWSHPAKIVQGLKYRASLLGTRYRSGCWPVAALPDTKTFGQLRAVRLTNGTRIWEVPCDLLACGFHLVPNTELATLLRCAFDDQFVRVDAEQRTSVPNVFCAGEPTGISGLDAALLQGEIAGLACAGRPTAHLQRRARAERRFARRLAKAFALRPELRLLPEQDTIVCRCEDVPFEKLRDRTGWTDAKLQTRSGMGPCQGRICGPALETLLGWKPVSVRPPVFPVPLDALCSTESSNTNLQTENER